MSEVQKPSVGRIVLFRSEFTSQASTQEAGIEVPAIITRVWNDHCVNLTVFRDGPMATPEAMTSVAYDERGLESTQFNSWRWPPRAS